MESKVLYDKLLKRKANKEKLTIDDLTNNDWHQLLFKEKITPYQLEKIFDLPKEKIDYQRKKYIKNIFSYTPETFIFHIILRSRVYNLPDASIFILKQINMDNFIGKANHKKEIIYGSIDSLYYKELYIIKDEIKKQMEIAEYNRHNEKRKETFIEKNCNRLYYLLKNNLITNDDLHFDYVTEEDIKNVDTLIKDFLDYMENKKIITTDNDELEIINNLESFGTKEVKIEFKPKKRKNRKSTNSKSYPRDEKISLNALKRVNFICEIDKNHYVFKRRKNNTTYTEPHHLIPMEYQYLFENSLDVEANIVSLCSNCHNEIHYGENYKHLIKQLYNERKEELKLCGIEITLEELYKMY